MGKIRSSQLPSPITCEIDDRYDHLRRSGVSKQEEAVKPKMDSATT